MKVLIVGSGGREHAIAWKVAQSPKVDKITALLETQELRSTQSVSILQRWSLTSSLLLRKKKRLT